MTTKEILDRTAKALAPSTVFGPPHTQDGITVIPAATVTLLLTAKLIDYRDRWDPNP